MSKILYQNDTHTHVLTLRAVAGERMHIMRTLKHDASENDIISLSKKEAIAISVHILLSYENELMQMLQTIREQYKNQI